MQSRLRLKWIFLLNKLSKKKRKYSQFVWGEMPIAKAVYLGWKMATLVKTAMQKAKVEQENIAGNVEAPVAFLTLFSINNIGPESQKGHLGGWWYELIYVYVYLYNLVRFPRLDDVCCSFGFIFRLFFSNFVRLCTLILFSTPGWLLQKICMRPFVAFCCCCKIARYKTLARTRTIHF